MPWPVHPTGFLASRGDEDSYKIERSLRFNSADSAYLNRTPASAGNRKTWTWSGWVKVGALSTERIFLSNTDTSGRYGLYFGFRIPNTLEIGDYGFSSFDWVLTTSALFRDTSAWYHIVASIDTTQATSSNRARLYVNGSQISSFSASTYPSLNADLQINSTSPMSIGRVNNNSYFYDGYITEVNFIDGQALTPSSFGETDPITGRWKAKRYAGTYGTNGFYLNFSDNSGATATTLGKDSSGNGNNWTPNNFSVTAGAGNDSLVDSPTNYGTDTGVGGEVRGNYCTLNPLETFSPNNVLSMTNGLLEGVISAGANAYFSAVGSQAITRGKYYWEVLCSSISSAAGTWMEIGIIPSNTDFPASNPIGYFGGGFSYTNDAYKANNGSYVSYGSSWTSNDIIGIALNLDASQITFYKNGVSQGVAYTIATTSEGYYPAISIYRSTGQSQSAIFNFGQRPFAYTAPSGFKALCTTNLPQPTIQKPSRYMDVVAYTGTGASNSISSLGFSPDLVWIKNRGTTTSHAIYDTTRGAQNQLSSDTTGDAVTSSTGLTAFGSNGFTVGTSSLVNTSGTQYVAWAWDEAPIAGMDVVSYAGTGANRTITHTLGVAPKMLIVKARTTAGADQGWPVWHTSIANTTYLGLNSTSGTATGTDYWNSTSPTSSVFSLGTNAAVNLNNDTYIAYLFAEVEGFSKFGSYTGNGSADGPFVWCGFRPRWVMIKASSVGGSAGYDWIIHDTQRSVINVSDTQLIANGSQAENQDSGGSSTSGSSLFDLTSNGFKIRTSTLGRNQSGQTFIFAAFAESPFKYARAR